MSQTLGTARNDAANDRGRRVRAVPRVTPLILALAVFNVLTIVLSAVGFAANLGLLSLLFPQAAVFFPSAWNDFLARGQIWFFFIAVALISTGAGALLAPKGYRGIGAFRAMTVCGAIVAALCLLIVGVLSLL